MRVRFAAEPSDAEVGMHWARMRATAEFWREFAEERRAGRSLDRSRRALQLVDPELCLDTSDPRCVVVRAAGDGAAHPLAEKVVEAAPDSCGWTAVSERPSRSVDVALEQTLNATRFDFRGSELRVGVGRGHLLEIVLRSPSVASAMDEQAQSAAQLLCALSLGDRIFSDWIGAVDVEPKPRPSRLPMLQAPSNGGEAEWLPVSDLPLTVDVARRRIVEAVGDVACHERCEHADWVMFELPEAENAADTDRGDAAASQDSRHADLLLGTTMLPEAWKCSLEQAPFSSARFSGVGECFAFLKYRSELVEPEQRFERRSLIEEALNHRLVPARLGCVAGTGLGTRYDYLLLAWTGLERAIAVSRQTLQEQRVPREAWFLFCDDRLRREWIPIWPGASAPPGM